MRTTLVRSFPRRGARGWQGAWLFGLIAAATGFATPAAAGPSMLFPHLAADLTPPPESCPSSHGDAHPSGSSCTGSSSSGGSEGAAGAGGAATTASNGSGGSAQSGTGGSGGGGGMTATSGAGGGTAGTGGGMTAGTGGAGGGSTVTPPAAGGGSAGGAAGGTGGAIAVADGPPADECATCSGACRSGCVSACGSNVNAEACVLECCRDQAITGHETMPSPAPTPLLTGSQSCAATIGPRPTEWDPRSLTLVAAAAIGLACRRRRS